MEWSALFQAFIFAKSKNTLVDHRKLTRYHRIHFID
ncbi:hypothetical protein DFP81_103109 [Marinomonas pollencensis]|uniref:Uncharacterized protein n=1 Tax=Marinomonas pollencensis TaxID=491954 RepID=A0A3E0DSI6_9GAMM|nr:hypothetical protein DFP81_103109 [Marinomonas pollencensis]